MGNALFGGTAEALALWFKQRGTESAFYWYVTVMLVIALITAITMPHVKKDATRGIAEDLRS